MEPIFCAKCHVPVERSLVTLPYTEVALRSALDRLLAWPPIDSPAASILDAGRVHPADSSDAEHGGSAEGPVPNEVPPQKPLFGV